LRNHADRVSLFVQWCAMLVLAFGVNQARGNSKRVTALAYAFQCSALMGTVWWIFIALHVYGEMPLALSLLGLVLLCAGLSLYWAVFAALYAGLMALGGQRQRRRGWLGDALQALGYGACWTLSELARGVWFTGFPWGSSGYAHTNTWLGQLAPWVGVYGLGWLSASLAMLCVLWLTPAKLGAARVRAGRAASAGLSGVRALLGRGLSLSLGWGLVWLMVLSLSGWPVSWVRTLGPTGAVLTDPSASSGFSGESTWKVTMLQGNVPMASQFTHARERNVGWRIDIFLVSEGLVPNVGDARIHPEQRGSDHCPISLELVL
jgi:apolipoprotein N-acyltransferase